MESYTKPSYSYNLSGMKPVYSMYSKDSTTEETEKAKHILKNNDLKIKKWHYDNNTYGIIRYDKNLLKKESFSTNGLFRSVIFSNGEIKCFSPPKSICFDDKLITKDYNFKTLVNPHNAYVEEYIEGTMINVFYNNGWEIATRSSVGGKVGFFTTSGTLKVEYENTFRYMFMDALNHLEKNGKGLFEYFNEFPKSYCFSFVMQHPKNRIVKFIEKPELYLVELYEIKENTINSYKIDDHIKSKLPSFIKYPKVFPLNGSYSTLDTITQEYFKSYDNVGVMLKATHTGVRSKIRNPKYEAVRNLRGNQPKLQFRYLMLRRDGKVKEYLTYYPEHAEIFQIYRSKIHIFTQHLYNNYISCFVKKQQALKKYSPEYRTHMYKLHEIYLETLKPISRCMNMKNVISYVNSIDPKLLMHSINFQNNPRYKN